MSVIWPDDVGMPLQSTLRRTIPASFDGGEPVHLVESWFRRSDPFGLTFNYGHDDSGRPMGLRVERDVLNSLLQSPDAMAPVADALMWMSGTTRLMIEFADAGGNHRLAFDAPMMRLFIEETEAVIPLGGEADVIAAEIDADIRGL